MNNVGLEDVPKDSMVACITKTSLFDFIFSVKYIPKHALLLTVENLHMVLVGPT